MEKEVQIKIYGCPVYKQTVASLSEAQKEVRRYTEHYDLGSSLFVGAYYIDGISKVYISYNGRAWTSKNNGSLIQEFSR